MSANPLKLFRYFVFGLFVVCNALIATIAVWNLSLINDAGAAFSSSQRTDAFLIFVGCAGLVIIFPIIFCDLAEKNVFFTKVWFECVWVGLFCVFELAAAATSTVMSAEELCATPPISIAVVRDNSPCTSGRVLQAFSWICALFLLGYFLLLFVTSLFKYSEDPTIWHCKAGKFPWWSARLQLGSAPVSPEGQTYRKGSLASRFKRNKSPVIVAPRPRNAANQDTMRHAILSYRSGLSLEYEIEHFNPNAPPGDVERRLVSPDVERPMPPIPSAQSPDRPMMSTREATSITFGNSLYPQHIQSVLSRAPTTTLQPQPASTIRPLPVSPPSVLGNWPQLNPPARGPGAKRKSNAKSLVQPSPAPAPVLPPVSAAPSLPPFDVSAEMSSFAPELTSTPPQQARESRSATPSSSRPPPSAISMNMVRVPPPAVVSQPLSSASVSSPPPSAFVSSNRSRPSGPRRPSLDEKKPAPLDLSKISNYNKTKAKGSS